MAERKKLTFRPDPTFPRKVVVELPSGDTDEIEFTFRHRTGKEAKALDEGLSGRDWADVLLDLAVGWEFAEPYDREHLDEFCNNYPKAAPAIYRQYVQALLVEKAKN